MIGVLPVYTRVYKGIVVSLQRNRTGSEGPTQRFLTFD